MGFLSKMRNITAKSIKWKEGEEEQEQAFTKLTQLRLVPVEIKEYESAMIALKDSPRPWKQHTWKSPKWTTQYGPDRNIDAMVAEVLDAAKKLDATWKKLRA